MYTDANLWAMLIGLSARCHRPVPGKTDNRSDLLEATTRSRQAVMIPAEAINAIPANAWLVGHLSNINRLQMAANSR
jgi:hypothetical protein